MLDLFGRCRILYVVVYCCQTLTAFPSISYLGWLYAGTLSHTCLPPLHLHVKNPKNIIITIVKIIWF
jgi:hypothetical protein